jgi:sugar phosphate isomerase/epimerase
MRLGVMNNPTGDPAEEIRIAADNGFEFIDLTLEYPQAHIDIINREAVLGALEETGLGVVGHTAYYLPFASAMGGLRDAAVRDVLGCLDFFKQAGAEIVTLHPDSGAGSIDPATVVSLNALSFKIISDEAEKRGMTAVVENVPGSFSSVETLKALLSAVPGLGFHLDVGHAHIRGNRFARLLGAFKSKLMHVHLSDNRFRADDHMPIGAGNIEWEEVIPALKKAGYDATITLEVFARDRRYVVASKEKVLELWNVR